MKALRRLRGDRRYQLPVRPLSRTGGEAEVLRACSGPVRRFRTADTRTSTKRTLCSSLRCLAASACSAGLPLGATLVVEERVGGEWRPVKPGDSGIPQWADPMSRPDVWQSIGEFLTAIMWNLLVGGTSNLWIKSREYGFPANVQAVPNRAVQITGGTGSDLVGVTVSGGAAHLPGSQQGSQSLHGVGPVRRPRPTAALHPRGPHQGRVSDPCRRAVSAVCYRR